MHKLLATSPATRPTGSPPQRKLLKISSGVYAGRLAALYHNSASGISLKYSDYPYQSWSDAQLLVSDANDSSFSACMDSSGNIYLAYTDSIKKIKTLKLTFSSGAWSVGTAYTVINVDDNYNPFILKDSNSTLWCFFVNYRTSSDFRYIVRVKSSANDGQTWGSGPVDTGFALSSSYVENGYVSACQNFSKIYAVYCGGRSNLLYRVYDQIGAIWGAEGSVVSMDYIDDAFDLEPSGERKIGVTFIPSSAGKVYFKDFDDLTWSGLIEIETCTARSPQIAYQDSLPHIFYAKSLGNGYYSLRHAQKSGGAFAVIDHSPALGLFDKVYLFRNAGSVQFQDKTTAAANTSVGDIFHSESQGLLNSVYDCLYLGKQSKFFCASLILSTAGAGGSVVWEYFTGVEWIEFTPSSGAYHFDLPDKLIYLFQDAASAPSAWQKGLVNNVSAYWIRARVSVGFSTNPVGTQILAALKCDDLALIRPGRAI